MKRFVILICLLFACNLLFAEDEIIYQQQHKSFNDITVVTLAKSAEDWYFISILIAENKSAVDKYIIYHTKIEPLQDLLFKFEKDNYYVERIEKMEKEESLIFLKESTSVIENIVMHTKNYLYLE